MSPYIKHVLTELTSQCKNTKKFNKDKITNCCETIYEHIKNDNFHEYTNIQNTRLYRFSNRYTDLLDDVEFLCYLNANILYDKEPVFDGIPYVYRLNDCGISKEEGNFIYNFIQNTKFHYLHVDRLLMDRKYNPTTILPFSEEVRNMMAEKIRKAALEFEKTFTPKKKEKVKKEKKKDE